jgi:hypothetical protein
MLSAKKELFTPSGGGYQISRSVRLRSSASAYLTRPFTTGNRKTFTFSAWVKKAVVGNSTGAVLFCSTDNATSTGWLHFNTAGVGSADTLTFEDQLTSTVLVTTQVFRDPSAWYHIILAIDTTQATASNRAKLYVNGTQVTAFSTATYPALNADTNFTRSSFRHTIGTQIAGSRYFDGYLADVNFIDGQALTPSSFGETNALTGVWQPKRYTGTYGTNGFYLPFSDNSGADSFGIGADKSANALNRVELGDTNVGYTILGTMTFASGGAAQVHLRDNNSTTAAADSGGLNTNTALGYDFGRAIKVRKIATLTAAANGTSVSSIFNIQYSDDNSTWTTVTGSATTHTFSAGLSQSNTTDIDDNGSHRYWRLKYLSGTTAGNFWIATLDMYINDIGPNSWFPVNVSTTAGATYDSMIDVPTPYGDGNTGRGNYAVMNPLAVTAANSTITNGNLQVVTPSVGGNAFATMGIPTTGKWYFEVTPTSNTGVAGAYIGVSAYTIASSYLWQNSNHVFYTSSGNKSVDGSSTAYGASYTDNDVIGVACDSDAGTITFYKNNTLQSSISHTMVDMFPALTDGASASGITYQTNFGQRPFSYTPPTGFVALNTQNLPDASIKKGNAYFDAKLWTGNGTSQTITGLGFQPDFAWIKARTTTYQHSVYDAVRTTSAGRLATDQNLGESSNGANDPSFTSDGITVRAVLNDNGSGQTFVGWMWDAGTTTVTNTSGSISSQVRANPTAGFSVVTYTGTGANATVGHGLGVAPKMFIVKERSVAGDDWYVYHDSIGAANTLRLNTTATSSAGGSAAWNSTAPTSTVFSLGTSAGVNQSTQTYVAYCFAQVAGYSAFSSYTGNGSADGPFVFTGFRPRWIMVKRTDSTSDWYIYDTARSTYNAGTQTLAADLGLAESSFSSTNFFDILSNGFKLRQDNASGYANASGGTYIYACFAENPFKHSLAR